MTTWVLLRGLAREARHWNGFDAALRRHLPAGDVVIAPDLPGNGRRCGERSPWSVRATAAAVREQVRTGGHGPPYVLVALSLGGMVALQWASDGPGEVAGCVLINSSLRGVRPLWERLRPAAAVELAGTLRPRLAPRVRERRILALTTNLRNDLRILAGRAAEYTRRSPVTPLNALRQLVAATRFRAPAAWPALPALVLASQGDRVVAPSCSQAIAQRWGVPLRVHPTAGHDLPLDDADWIIGELLAWWAQAQGGRQVHAPRPLTP